MRRRDYIALRDRYTPKHIKLVIIAESPPTSGLYFYKPGSRREPLFAELMKQAGLDPLAFESKEDGLIEFAQRGWLLVDATYQPVNDLEDDLADEIIKRQYWRLRADLLRHTRNKTTPLVLIKANVCKILKPRLVQDGFNVLNRRAHPPFPRPPFHHKTFRKRFRSILKRAGMNKSYKTSDPRKNPRYQAKPTIR
jgi:hypothetical protein